MSTRNTVPQRIHNPFSRALVTELIEDPELYARMFSEEILVGETLEVFRPNNVIVTGPLGSGKSMLLNLIRYKVLSEYVRDIGSPPGSLRYLSPFFGISINLVRANFHAFGRRSIARVVRPNEPGSALDIACAADFLVQYLFHDFLSGLRLVSSPRQTRFAEWLGIDSSDVASPDLAQEIANWPCWRDYYRDCNSLDALIRCSAERLRTWAQFLAATGSIPESVLGSLTTLEEPLHQIGNLLRRLNTKKDLSLYVVFDQYEDLPELNETHGTELQRVLNSLIKARDPVVFCKIGARTHDWGKELRVWGADSRIEFRRDYIIVDLAELLVRQEHTSKWLFPKLAFDVAAKRIVAEGYRNVSPAGVRRMFGSWDAAREASEYIPPDKVQRILAHDNVKGVLEEAIIAALVPELSALEVKLASAWVLQKLRRRIKTEDLLQQIGTRPWRWKWWKKERIEVALIQLSSIANQRKKYFGWRSVLMLSGSNISAFLLIFKEVWDRAAKMETNPLDRKGIPVTRQSEGIRSASEIWSYRDAEEKGGGARRHAVLSRLGTAIHAAVEGDPAISNPGHSGFSLRESDLIKPQFSEMRNFLNDGVKLGILEERLHTSKTKGDGRRRKYYLHPLLSPYFCIPFTRVKEPLYINDPEIVNSWIFGGDRIRFSARQERDVRP